MQVVNKLLYINPKFPKSDQLITENFLKNLLAINDIFKQLIRFPSNLSLIFNLFFIYENQNMKRKRKRKNS